MGCVLQKCIKGGVLERSDAAGKTSRGTPMFYVIHVPNEAIHGRWLVGRLPSMSGLEKRRSAYFSLEGGRYKSLDLGRTKPISHPPASLQRGNRNPRPTTLSICCAFINLLRFSGKKTNEFLFEELDPHTDVEFYLHFAFGQVQARDVHLSSPA